MKLGLFLFLNFPKTGSNIIQPGEPFGRLRACVLKSMWYIYILLCDQKTFYVGITDDLKRRVKQHKSKYSRYTKRFSDVRLVYFEKYQTRTQAEKREIQLKNWSIAKRKALIKGDIALLKQLSKGPEPGEKLGS